MIPFPNTNFLQLNKKCHENFITSDRVHEWRVIFFYFVITYLFSREIYGVISVDKKYDIDVSNDEFLNLFLLCLFLFRLDKGSIYLLSLYYTKYDRYIMKKKMCKGGLIHVRDLYQSTMKYSKSTHQKSTKN